MTTTTITTLMMAFMATTTMTIKMHYLSRFAQDDHYDNYSNNNTDDGVHGNDINDDDKNALPEQICPR
jgi:hypothetical protein